MMSFQGKEITLVYIFKNIYLAAVKFFTLNNTKICFNVFSNQCKKTKC